MAQPDDLQNHIRLQIPQISGQVRETEINREGKSIIYALRSDIWRSYPREEPLPALPARLEGDAQAAQAEHSLAGHNQRGFGPL